MKAQFKYAIRAGLYARGPVFAVILIMNLVFIVLGALGALPFAAKVTAVSLGGVAIVAMMAFNIVSDVAIARRMFSAPGAYLYALTPVPRRKTLLASVITMVVMDNITLATVIISEVILSFNLADENTGAVVWEVIRANSSGLMYILLYILFLLASYMLIVMIIMFCISVRKSALYNKPAGGLLAALLALGLFYAVTLSSFILAPFGVVSRFGIFFTITLGGVGMAVFALLLLIEAAALFILTSKLLERKVNL